MKALKSDRKGQAEAPRLRRSVVMVYQALRGLRGGAAGLAAFQLFAFSPTALALPTDGVVVGGDPVATVATTGSTMNINQVAPKAIINWKGFSIDFGETVDIAQPSSSAVLLNRVIPTELPGGGFTPPASSVLAGTIKAPGHVFLVNPSGVLFTSTASVEVGSLVASTLNITDDHFTNGNYTFFRDGTTGGVVNEATFTLTAPSSYAALIGPQVTNAGTINVLSGSVALAAGDQVTLNLLDGLIGVSVTAAALNAAVLNPGSITANGGTVFLTARSANELLSTVINNTGIVRATSLTERDGAIILDGGSVGIVSNSNTLETVAGDPGTVGGSIQVKGEQVALLTGSQVTSDGGTIAITSTAGTEINGVISTGNASDDAVVIKAGVGRAAGDATGGDITVGAGTSIIVGLGGRATLYTGSIVGSTGLAGLVGSGSGNFRYNSTPSIDNFTAALGDDTYAIYREQPILDVTVTSSTIKIYGTDDPASRTFTAAGYVNGDSNGITGTFQRDGGESVGSYSLTQGTLASDVGYGFSLGTQALAIMKADVTATIANQSKTYGEDDPELPIAASVTGLVDRTVITWNGSVDVDDSALTSQATALERNAGENVGTYSVTDGTFTAPSANYNAPTYLGSATLTIGAADLTATIANQSKSYGEDDPELPIAASVTGLVDRTVITWNGSVDVDDSALTSQATALERNAGENVGSYSVIDGTFTTPSLNYNAPTYSGIATLTIGAADLTATIANQSKTYGEDDPALPIAASVTGLVNATVTDWNGTVTSINDSALTSQATALERTAGENVGSYSVTDGTFTAPSANYNAPTYLGSATLTIGAADLTATIANQSKTYGEDDPELPIAASVTGLVDRTVITWNGSVDVDDSALTSQATALERNAGENVGTYSVTDGTFTAPSANYNAPTYSGSATLTIGAADLTATIANQSKTYGEDDPELPIAASVTGLVNTTVTDWNGTVTSINDSALTSQATELARTAGENVGTYSVTDGTFTAPSLNYNAPTYLGSATLAINQKPITVTAQTATKIYDGNITSEVAPAITGGLVNDSSISTWNGNIAIADTSGFSQAYDTKDVGTGKTLTASGVVNDGNGGNNYSVTFVTDPTGEITRLGSVTWIGGSTGDWSVANNWQSEHGPIGAIPDKANVENVNLNGGRVTFDANVPATSDGSVQVAEVTGGKLNVEDGWLQIATLANLTGYTQSGGLTQVNGNLIIVSADPVTQTSGSLTVTGTSNIDADRALIDLSWVNDFGGTLTVKGGTTKITDINGLTVELDTGSTTLRANTPGTVLGELVVGGTATGFLVAISEGGALEWTGLTAPSAVLIAGKPLVDITADHVPNPNLVQYTDFANAGGGTLTVAGRLVLVSANIADGDVAAQSAILKIGTLDPSREVKLQLTDPIPLRLLVDSGFFDFKSGSVFPGGVSSLNPADVRVCIAGQCFGTFADMLAIGDAQRSAVSSASADARQSFGTDSVTQQIDMGFAGDVGIAPTMGHSVPLEGEIINTPECVPEAKSGIECR